MTDQITTAEAAMKDTMTFGTLSRLVEDVLSDERRMSVRFNCDCGCGGDAYTAEEWDDMCERADEARARLIAFGVVFGPEI